MAFSRQAASKACWLAFILFWSCRGDSNSRPADYKSAALPTELRQLISLPLPASGTPGSGTIIQHLRSLRPDTLFPARPHISDTVSPHGLPGLLQGLYYFFLGCLFCHTPCFSPTPIGVNSQVSGNYIYILIWRAASFSATL